MNDDDGGPAFPILNVHQSWDHDRGTYGVETDVTATGMSLRDYFAAHAPAPPSSMNDWSDTALQSFAKNAYRWADAMMEARK